MWHINCPVQQMLAIYQSPYVEGMIWWAYLHKINNWQQIYSKASGLIGSTSHTNRRTQ